MTYEMQPLSCNPARLKGLSEKLVNQWATDHTCCLAGASPIIALDMYERSYHMDYGAKAAAYVDAFLTNINWQNTSRLFTYQTNC